MGLSMYGTKTTQGESIKSLIKSCLDDFIALFVSGYAALCAHSDNTDEPGCSYSNSDKRRARVMVQDINKKLFERRLIRNMEKFVGGREYGNDIKLLERTI
nr:hypothetical protein [Tanacetum cinerariifolium]